MSFSVILMAASAGLLTPARVLGKWNKAAFAAASLQAAMKATFGSDLTEASDKISIQAPIIAENGAIVPVSVSSTIENIDSITLFSVNNRMPLLAQFELNKDTQAAISTRIKMAKSSHIIAVISADGKQYSSRQEIKVTIGGCQEANAADKVLNPSLAEPQLTA